MLSTFWFLYMAGWGIFFPFFALYLRENAGLTGTQAGIVFAMIPAASLLAPTYWGHIADRAASRARVLAVVLVASTVTHLALGQLAGFPALVIGTAVFALFSTAVLPLGVSVSLSVLGATAQYRFGAVRVWGSIGFLVVVLCFPWLLDAWEAARGLRGIGSAISEPALGIMFPVTAAFMLAAAIPLLWINDRPHHTAHSHTGDWRTLLTNHRLLRLLIFGFLTFLFLQGPMTFFPTFVRDRGGTLDTVSILWLVMLIPEIPIVALSGAAIRRFGARGIIAGGVLAGGIRWTLCALTNENWIIYPVQALHGVFVVGIVVGGPVYLKAIIPENLQSTAQGLLAMASAGLGALASSVVTGWLFDQFGVNSAFLAGGIGALALGLGTAWILPPPPEEVLTQDSATTDA